MKKVRFQVGLILGLGVFMLGASSHALAQGKSEAEVTETSAETSVQNKYLINYKNIFSGISLSNSEPSDEAEVESTSVEQQLSGGYRISDDASAAFVTVWNWTPQNANPFQAADPYVKLGHEALIQTDLLKVGADLRMSIPISENSKKVGLVTAVASEQETMLQIPGSKARFELTTFLQRNFDTTEEDSEDFEIHFEPGLAYQFREELSAKVAYESKMTHTKHKDLTMVDNKEAAFQTGVKWDITRQLNVSPYVDVSAEEPTDISRARIGAELNWAIL